MEIGGRSYKIPVKKIREGGDRGDTKLKVTYKRV
jgi:hypothetical protein